MDPVDELVFAVRLVKSQFKSELSGDVAAIGFDVSKRFVAVNVRLALAEKIEVGTIEDVDDTTHGWLRIRVRGGEIRLGPRRSPRAVAERASLMSISCPASDRVSAIVA